MSFAALPGFDSVLRGQPARAALGLGFDPTGIRGTPFGRLGDGGGDPTGVRGGSLRQPGFDPLLDMALPDWQRTMALENADVFGMGPLPGGADGAIGSLVEFPMLDQWNADFQNAAALTGMPVNLLKAIAAVESGGDPNATGAPGVVGVMQINTLAWGNGPWNYDTSANIRKGAEILKSGYDQYGNTDMAIRSYLGFGTDILGTSDQEYLQRVTQYWQQLDAGGGSFSSGGGIGNISAIWGGGNYPVSQEFGPTPFSMGPGAWMYDYGPQYGVQGHPGLDVGTPLGTQLYAPMGGTVEIAGGSGYYQFNGDGASPGVGELRLRLDNGHILILGHMSQIGVRPGQRVTPGMMVGLSGAENGAHVHIEYRVPDPSTSSGWRIVDPRGYVSGGAVGVQQPQATGYGGYTSPLDVGMALLMGYAVPGYSA